MTPARPVRILVVDDSADAADTLAVLVRAWGYDVQVAYNAAAALLAARSFLPDIILMDLVMPGVSGGELARQLRKEPDIGAPTLIAVSGNPAETRKEFWQSQLFEGCFLKPVDPDELRRFLLSERALLAKQTPS